MWVTKNVDLGRASTVCIVLPILQMVYIYISFLTSDHTTRDSLCGDSHGHWNPSLYIPGNARLQTFCIISVPVRSCCWDHYTHVANNRLVSPNSQWEPISFLSNRFKVLYTICHIYTARNHIVSYSAIMVPGTVPYFEHLLCTPLGHCLSGGRSQSGKCVDLP